MWPYHTEQFWECKLVNEGVIDQGGGFRDTLCDVAEELCPSQPGAHLKLPYFITTPNSHSSDGELTYIPNPQCMEFAVFEWIGKLIGACYRTKDTMVLPLSELTWRMLIGEEVTWQDYASVDKQLVDALTTLEHSTKETFLQQQTLLDSFNFTIHTVNGHRKEVCPNGEKRTLDWKDRIEYVQLVRKFLLHDAHKQIEAISKGLRVVIPSDILLLTTWQDLELKVCGAPVVDLEVLKKNCHCEDFSSDSKRVKLLWAVVEKFSNEERCNFLRFISGRKRLPVSIFICGEKEYYVFIVDTKESFRLEQPIDSLPLASTCSNTLFLPEYSSEEILADKLRLAINHCVAIDADGTPYDDN